MKKLKTIMMLAIAALMAACSSDDEITENKPADGREVIIGVSMPEDTRVALNDLSLTWEEGDQLIVAGEDENYRVINEGNVFEMISEPGQTSAQFKGILPEGITYSVYYKAKNLERNSYDYDINYAGITQNGINSSEHLKDYMLIFKYGITKEDLQKFHLYYQEALLRIDVRSLPEGLTSIKNIKWFINYDDEANKRELGSMTFNGEIKNLTTAEEHNYIYLPFDGSVAFKQQPGKKMALEIEGNTSATVYAVATQEKAMVSGRHDMTVTADQNAKGALNQWEVINTTEGPAANEVWVKFADNAAMSQTITDNNGVVYTLSAEPNAEGWYAYSREGAIRSAESLFQDNNSITEAWLPNSMKEVSDYMFWNCSNLTSVKLPNELELLGYYAFSNCQNMNNVVVPATVTKIDDHAFAYFGNWPSDVTLKILAPKSVLKTIIDNIFYASNNLPRTCDLYIHESWRQDCTGNSWQYNTNRQEFRSIHFVDDSGKEVQ